MTPGVYKFASLVPCPDGAKVLEVGSLNVNGTVRPLFTNASSYTGIDIRPGPCVDRVMTAEGIPGEFAQDFDVVISCETFEHCKDWRGAMRGAFWALKPGGLMCVTTPTKGKGRHDYPNDYWRWTLDEYKHIFQEQEVLHAMEWDRWVGIWLRKVTDDLHMDFEPYAVP